MSKEKQFGFNTRMVHAGHIPDSQTGARAVPIYQTSSFVFYDADRRLQGYSCKSPGRYDFRGKVLPESSQYT